MGTVAAVLVEEWACIAMTGTLTEPTMQYKGGFPTPRTRSVYTPLHEQDRRFARSGVKPLGGPAP